MPMMCVCEKFDRRNTNVHKFYFFKLNETVKLNFTQWNLFKWIYKKLYAKKLTWTLLQKRSNQNKYKELTLKKLTIRV